MTEPLTPIDLDLRDFGFMPLEVVRLRDSDLAALATGDEFRAAVLLWCAAWHQVPAASLPNDDRLLAKLAGFGRDLKGWDKVRGEALRGFLECSDGRLYHPVIADIAIESGSKKKKQKTKTLNATEARKRKAKERRDGNRDGDRDGPRDEVQGRGEEGRGRERTQTEADKSADRESARADPDTPEATDLVPSPKPPTVDYAALFERWYAAYPKKVDRRDAEKSFVRVLKSQQATFEQLLAGAERYAQEMSATEKRFIKAPAVWLNKESWLNEPGAYSARPPVPSKTDSIIEGMFSDLTPEDFHGRTR